MRRAVLLLLSILACSSPAGSTRESANELAERTPALVVSVESTSGPELRSAAERFEHEHLDDVRGLIAAWQPLTQLRGTLRIVLVDAARSDRAVVGEVYGPTHRVDAQTLLARLDALDPGDNEGLLSLMEEGRCRFPGLGNPTVLHYPTTAMATGREELVAWFRDALRRLDDESIPPRDVARVFGRDKSTTYATEASRCSMIVLSNRLTDGAFPPSERDVVLHEVAHVLDIVSRARPTSSGYQARALGEALADVMSHAYSGSACHVPRPSPPGCMRRLDVPQADSSAPDGALPDWYTYGQPSRFAGWSLVAGKPILTVGRALLDARDAALAVDREFPTGLIYGRLPTAPEKAVLLQTERETQQDFLARLPH